MGAKSKIEWTDATWTPIRARVKHDAANIAEAKGYTSLLPILKPGRVGPHCEHVSPGCDNCYSETSNRRCLTHNGTGLPFDRRSRDLVDIFMDEKILGQPLHWKKPRKIFVCSQTDLFGEWLADEIIDRVFLVMALCQQHTFQVLTKRSRRMQKYCSSNATVGRLVQSMAELAHDVDGVEVKCSHNEDGLDGICFPNVWLGVSVENQPTADQRIPLLVQTPAALRFVSYEPALGPVDLRGYLGGPSPFGGRCSWEVTGKGPFLNWVIAGGESGPGARPAHPDWFRAVRDQCQAAGVPFFFKQWGEWFPALQAHAEQQYWYVDDPDRIKAEPDGEVMVRIGKKASGALLDGREWREMPRRP